MNALEVSEELWEVIQPLLPPKPPKPKGGRPRVPNRNVLAGIVFMLLTGCPWRELPAKWLGCGSPVTCWRRVRDWQRAGVWEQLHHTLLNELRRAGSLDWSRCSLDSISLRQAWGKRLAQIPSTVASPVPSTT
jgi:transposase